MDPNPNANTPPQIPQLEITVFGSLAEAKGTRRSLAWTEVPAFISTLPEAALFSCATFREDLRHLSRVERLGAIVLDHDAASIPVERAAFALNALDAIIYETKSPGRWRAIVRLAEPLSPAGYSEAAAQLSDALDCAPESTRPAQIWFPPRRGASVLVSFGDPIVHTGETSQGGGCEAADTPGATGNVFGEPPAPSILHDSPEVSGAYGAAIQDEYVRRLIELDASIPPGPCPPGAAAAVESLTRLRRSDGKIDRSSVDLALIGDLVIRCGLSNAEIRRIMVKRGSKSHTVGADTEPRPEYLSRTIAKARGVPYAG